jgi:hypothetical protein
MKHISLLVLSIFLLTACEKTFLQGSNLTSEESTLAGCESIVKIGSTFVTNSDHMRFSFNNLTAYGSSAGLGSGEVIGIDFTFSDNTESNQWCMGSGNLLIGGSTDCGSGVFTGTLEVYPSQAKANLCYLRFVNKDLLIGTDAPSGLYAFKAVGSADYSFFDYFIMGSSVNVTSYGSYPLDSFPEIDEFLNQDLHTTGAGVYR